MLNFCKVEAHNAFKASALILNTFHEFEPEVIKAIKYEYHEIYTMNIPSEYSEVATEHRIH